MALTDLEIRTAKAIEKPRKLFDGGGLYLRVDTKGSKLWRMAYRFEGKEGILSFGKYPDVVLKDARKRRDEARSLLAAGIDPSQQKKLDKITKALTNAATFDAIAEEYLAKKIREGMAASTVKRLRSQLRYVIPAIGKRPIADITTPEVLAPLKKIEAKGIFETATRTKELCGAVFRYGMAKRPTSVA